MLAHQIEHDPRIDIARRLAGRHLEVVQIYLAHGVQVFAWFNLSGFVLEPNYMLQKNTVKVGALAIVS